jgi:hypothetical protein
MREEMVRQQHREFTIPWRKLLPGVCPVCGYSLKELPEPRCPECGERIAEGEVVIMGIPVRRDSGGKADRESWLREIVTLLTAAAIAFLIEGLSHPIWKETGFLLVFALIVGVLIIVVSLKWWLLKRHGFPAGVIRLSPGGYCFGAGEGQGAFRQWPRSMRVHAIARGPSLIRLRGASRIGPLEWLLIFDVFVPCPPEALEGIIERIIVWGPAKLDIRRKGYQFWPPGTCK